MYLSVEQFEWFSIKHHQAPSFVILIIGQLISRKIVPTGNTKLVRLHGMNFKNEVSIRENRQNASACYIYYTEIF